MSLCANPHQPLKNILLFNVTRLHYYFTFQHFTFHNDRLGNHWNEWRSTDVLFSLSDRFLPVWPMTQWTPRGSSPVHGTMERKFRFCPLKPIDRGWSVFLLCSVDFPAADWTRSGESNPKPTRVGPSLCFCPRHNRTVLNLSSVKSTAQRRLRSHTCIRLTRPQSAHAGVFLFLLCAFNPCLLLFWNVWYLHKFWWNQFTCKYWLGLLQFALYPVWLFFVSKYTKTIFSQMYFRIYT